MKRVSLLLAAMSLGATAQAATVSFQYGLPITESTTEISQTGLLGLFNPALGTLTGATLTYFTAGTTTITLTNTSNQSQTARSTAAIDVLWSSSLAALDPLLTDQQLLFTTGAALSYAPGQTRTFGPLIDSTNSSPSVASILAPLTGVGTFALTCQTLTSITAIGGSGFVRATQNAFAGCGALIVYNYTPGPPVTNVPEPSTLALLGLGLAGIGAASRRRSA